MKIDLGDEVKDIVSGATGIVVCRSSYLSGCDRISIQMKMEKDNKVPDWHTFDVTQAKLIKSKKIVLDTTPTIERVAGGPRPNPDRR